MKVKITAKGFSTIANTVSTVSYETCVGKKDTAYMIGRLVYPLEGMGFQFDTHDVFTEFMRNTAKLDQNKLTTHYLPIVNKKFGTTKITISLAEIE